MLDWLPGPHDPPRHPEPLPHESRHPRCPETIALELPVAAEPVRNRRGQRNRDRLEAHPATGKEANGGLFIPEDIRLIRETWFVPGTFQITAQKFQEQWRWVSYFYLFRETYRRKNGTEKKYYRCKFWKKASTTSEGAGIRARNMRSIGECPCRVTSTQIAGSDVLNIEVQKGHNHPMGDFDHVGRPKAILEHVAYLLELGKSSKEVEKVVMARGEEPEERQRIIDAGGRQL